MSICRRTAVVFLLLIAVFTAQAWSEWIAVSPGTSASGDAVVVEDLGSTIRLSFTLGGYEEVPILVDGTECVRVSVPGMAPRLKKGDPELPIWAKSVIIPDQGRVSLKVLASSWDEIPSRPVVPSKGNLYRDIDPGTVPYEFGDSYLSDVWTPQSEVSLSDPFILRDFRGVTIMMNPIQYNGGRGVLRVCREMLVEISVEGTGGLNTKTRHGKEISREFSAIYENMFLNSDRTRYVISEHAGRMLILAADAFHDDMADLVTWKNEKGIETKIVKYSEIGGTGETAVKNYIQSEYNDPGVTFVLLVGDKVDIPTPTFSGGEADPMYSLLEGGDVYPDAFISRFSVGTVANVQTMVDRSIDYELSPTVATDWYHKATGVASSEGSPADWQWMNGFRDKLLAYNYTAMDQIYDPGASASEVTNALNNGRGLVLYMGHGSPSAWGTTDFSVSNINALTNDWMLPVVSCVACDNGDFSYDNCFGEAWLRATHNGQPSGGIASYASSIGQSWVPPQYGQQGLVDSLVNDRYNTIGGLLFMGSVAMLEHYGGGYEAQEIFNTWIIFGDCSVQMRTDVPATMSVSHPSAVPVGTQQIHVAVSGVPNALVAFSKDGELLGAGYTDGSGEVDVTLFEALAVPGTVRLTVTAYNRIPFTVDITVMSPDGPYVIYTGNTVLGDGEADVGESVSIDVELENVGSETAYAVQGALSTAEAEITFISSVQGYGDIGAGSTALPISPFAFDVGSVPDQTVVSFDIDISSGDSLWTGSFGISIHAPILAQAGWQINDSSGNGNGRPDAGETVDLTIVVGNTGSGDAESAQLTLDDSDPYVTITEPSTQSLGQILSGGQVTSPSFTVTFDAACPEAYPAVIPLQFSSNGGVYNTTGSLTLIVGQRELLFVDSDNEDTETRLITALDAWGGSYTRLNVYSQETVPLDTLLSYRMILWSAGDQNVSSLTAANQTNMASYLDQGGSLLFTAENYLSSYGSTSFTSDYLHVGSYTVSVSGTVVNGVAGDPIGDGVSVTLNYPTGLAEYPDRVSPNAQAAEVFRMQGTNDPVAIRYPATGSAAYQVIFFGAPLEAFPTSGSDPNNIQAVVSRSLSFLGGGGDALPPTIPADVMLSSDGTLTWSASSDNVGVDHYLIYRSTAAYFNVQGLTPVRTSTGTSEAFPGSVGNTEINYCFRVTAKDSAGNESAASDPAGEHDFDLAQ